MHAVSRPYVTIREEPGPCPICDKPMQVQKTVTRKGNTLAHGSFSVRETVYVCPTRCHHPGGTLATRRALDLQESILPNRSIGYDVMTFVGKERYLHHRQREEIQDRLRYEHGISISTGTISNLASLFGNYLRALHETRADEFRAILESDGGWPLHVDATGENGRGTMLIAYSGWRKWVLGAWKIPTERIDAILPRLREVVRLFGSPCAIVRDLGKAMISAVNDLTAEFESPVPILSCHAHFLSDVGEGLLDDSHTALRKLFRKHKIRTGLRIFVREIGRTIECDVVTVRSAVQNWQTQKDTNHDFPADKLEALGVVRALAQWALDYPTDSSGADFPFDRPYLDFYDRCIHVRKAIDTFHRIPEKHKEVCRALRRLAHILNPVRRNGSFTKHTRTLSRRAKLFDELRSALHLFPHGDDNEKMNEPSTREPETQDIQSAIRKLVLSLEKRASKRGQTKDLQQAIGVILTHLNRYESSLWGHAIFLPSNAGGGVRLVPRTNNLLEGFNRELKQGERRRSGRKILSSDFEHLPPEAALARNLLHPDYVEVLCGSLEQLPQAFADLDTVRRRQNLLNEQPIALELSSFDSPNIIATSLPKEDRQLVRSSTMKARILAAARCRRPNILINRSPA